MTIEGPRRPGVRTPLRPGAEGANRPPQRPAAGPRRTAGGQIWHVIKRSAFLPIASPRLVKEPPTGPDWLHEVKFDGFRIQIHKAGDEVRLYSRNGKDFTDRFPAVAAAALGLGAKKAVLDGELVVCDGSDRPDFYALLGRRLSGLCVWCFDLLSLNGRDLRSALTPAQEEARGCLKQDRQRCYPAALAHLRGWREAARRS